jgi:hypothetical protein
MGGTCTIIAGKYNARIRDPTTDSKLGLGRWSTTTMQGSKGRSLTIITGYRVCKSSITATGPSTAYRQQWAILNAAGDQNPDPHKQFLTDLLTFITETRDGDDKHEILLMLDANESTMENNSQIAKFAAELNLIDLHLHHHRHMIEENPPPHTHETGSKRIDYIFGTSGVANNILSAGYTAFHSVFDTDHRGAFVDVHMNNILDGGTCDLYQDEPRNVNGKDPKVFQPFKKEVAKYMDEHTVTGRASKLEHLLDKDLNQEEKDKLEEALNGLDEDLQRACMHADKKCKQPWRLTPWSSPVIKARQQLRYWCLWHGEMDEETQDLSTSGKGNQIQDQKLES